MDMRVAAILNKSDQEANQDSIEGTQKGYQHSKCLGKKVILRLIYPDNGARSPEMNRQLKDDPGICQ